MVEVLVAITILLLAIAGPMTIASKGLQSSYFARDQVAAYMLAQEGVEIFTALRNEAALAEFNGGDPDRMWDWVDDAAYADCFTADGCNVHIDAVGAGDRVSDEVTVVSCDPVDDCIMDYDETRGRARYYVNPSDTSTDSIYTRVITLTKAGGHDELQITSSIIWDPVVFGASQTIVVSTSLFNQYGNF